MSKTQTQSPNRSSVLFVAGLLLAAGFAVGTDGLQHALLTGSAAEIAYDDQIPVQTPRPLTALERDQAEVAWRYFEVNFRPESGFVDSVAGYPSGTLWDQGSYLFAMMSARGIGLIGREKFDSRVIRLLAALEQLALFEDTLPNKVYHSRTLEMVDYKNAPAPDGVGWSALDIGRMLAAFRILELRHPEYAAPIRRVLQQWNLAAMASDGQLRGAQREGGQVLYRQEGRLGYEQYAARAAALWGLDGLAAGSALRVLDWKPIHGIDVPVDRRRASTFRAITPTLSEPYVMQGLELGFDRETAVLAARVYEAQERRFDVSGQLTMVSEDNINQEPYFLYSSVYSNGRDWAVVSEKGKHYPELRTVSLKAAFAWDALFATDYTARVKASLSDLATDRGWASGRYEETGEINSVVTANTNAVVLEALHFTANGPLWTLH